MEFRKRHDTTDNGLLPAPTCYGLVTDLIIDVDDDDDDERMYFNVA